MAAAEAEAAAAGAAAVTAAVGTEAEPKASTLCLRGPILGAWRRSDRQSVQEHDEAVPRLVQLSRL